MANYRFNPALLYGDPVAPMRSDYGGGSDITRLLMEQGRAQAEGALQRGQIWQNAIQQGAQQLAGGFEKAAEEKKIAKRDQAWLALINDPDVMKDPKAAYAGTVKVWGPGEADQHFQALVGAHQIGQPKRNPEADTKALGVISASYLKAGPAGRALQYPTLRALAVRADPIYDQHLPPQHSLDADTGLIAPFAEQFAPEKKPGSFDTVPTAEGIKSFNKQTGEAGPVIGQSPAPKAPEPSFQAKDVLLDGKPAMVNFDAHSGRYTANGQDVSSRVRPIPPQGPQPREPQWTDAEDAQGNPILVDKASGQVKPYPGGAQPKAGASEANRIAAAEVALNHSEEIKKYLSQPEVRDAIGPLMGRYNSLAQAAGVGDPVAIKLVGMLKSHAALQPQIHGFRAVKFAEDIESLFNTHQSAESLEAAMNGVDSAAVAVRDRRRVPAAEGATALENPFRPKKKP